MTFTPKGEEEIRQEVVEDLKGDDEDFNEADHEDKINRITQRRLKDEETKGSLHKQKTKRQELLEKNGIDLETGKPKVKAQDSKKGQQDKVSVSEISAVDLSEHFAKGGTRTELRYVEKVMKATGKKFREAKQDGLFISWKKENDAKTQSREAQMPPAQGGGRSTDKTEQGKIVEKFSQDLPAGFSAKPKSK